MGDCFKIVVIKRDTATELEYTYVPYQWVQNGFVFLPPNNRLTLRDNPTSAPGPEWERFECEIKKDFIVGKEEAQLCPTSEKNWSSDGQLLAKTNAAPLTNIGSEQINPSIQNEGGMLVPEFGNDTFNAADNVPISKNEVEVLLNTKFETLSTSQRQIEKNQLRMLEMQESLEQKLDKIYGIIKNLHDRTIPKPTTSHEEPNESGFESKFSFPLNTVSDVQMFNSEINKNAEYKKYLINTYKIIGGTEGKIEGKPIANIFVDTFFTTEVLAMFSWTGMSKTTGVQKIGFSFCCGILNFFTEIVLLADSCWNNTKSENLFKACINNAKQTNKRHQKKKNKIPAGRQEESDKVPDATNPDNAELPLQNNVHAGGEKIVNNNII